MSIKWLSNCKKEGCARDVLTVSTTKSGKSFYFYDEMESVITNNKIVFGIDYGNNTLWMKGSDRDGYKPVRNHNTATIHTRNIELEKIKDGRYEIKHNKNSSMYYAIVEFNCNYTTISSELV